MKWRPTLLVCYICLWQSSIGSHNLITACTCRPYSCPCPGASCKWQGTLEQVMPHLTQQHKSITTLQGQLLLQLVFNIEYQCACAETPSEGVLQHLGSNGQLIQDSPPLLAASDRESASTDTLWPSCSSWGLWFCWLCWYLNSGSTDT